MCEGFIYNFAFRPNIYKFGTPQSTWFIFSAIIEMEMPVLNWHFFYLQVIKNFLLLINIFQMKYLQNDLITPLERLAESDVLYVKVHSRKKCMFVKCERLVIISKLWQQSYACYGEN